MPCTIFSNSSEIQHAAPLVSSDYNTNIIPLSYYTVGEKNPYKVTILQQIEKIC